MYDQVSRHILLYEYTLEEVIDMYDDGLDFEDLKAQMMVVKFAEAWTGKKAKKGTKESIERSIERHGNKEQKERLAKRRKKEEEE